MFPSEDGQYEIPTLIAAELKDFRESLRSAAQRITVKELAYDLNLDPESVHNQLRFWSRRKKPSADLGYLAQRKDKEHATFVAARCGYVLHPTPRRKPEDALRSISERASKGYVSAAEVSQILSETDFGGRR